MSKSIGGIKKEFEQADRQTLLSLYEKYADDNRSGVVSLISKYKKQEEKLEAEKRESLALKNALIRGGICAGFIVLLSLSMVMCGK